jgi:hypothetical protein
MVLGVCLLGMFAVDAAPRLLCIIDGSEEHIQLTSTAESRSEENNKDRSMCLCYGQIFIALIRLHMSLVALLHAVGNGFSPGNQSTEVTSSRAFSLANGNCAKFHPNPRHSPRSDT